MVPCTKRTGFCAWYHAQKELVFTKKYKNLAGYRFENNFVIDHQNHYWNVAGVLKSFRIFYYYSLYV